MLLDLICPVHLTILKLFMSMGAENIFFLKFIFGDLVAIIRMPIMLRQGMFS
jgi:hypothetical protein